MALAIYALACYSEGGVSWAPDDKWFAFTTLAPSTQEKAEFSMQVWKYDVGRKELELVDQDLAPTSRPAVSPDGKWILYLRQDETRKDKVRVFMYDVVEKTRRELGRVTAGGKEDASAAVMWGPAWSKDGKSFAVTTGEAGTAVVDIRDCKVTRTVANLIYANWMPDGSGLVGVEPDKETKDAGWLVHEELGTGKRTQLMRCTREDEAGKMWPMCVPMISAKGTYVADMEAPPAKGEEAAEGEKAQLVVMGLKDGKVIASFPGKNVPMGWTGDEKGLYLLARDEVKKVWNVVRWDPAGGEGKGFEVPAPFGSAEGIWGTLSHDGKWAVLRMNEDEKKGDVLALVNLETKEARGITPTDASRKELAMMYGDAVMQLVEEKKVAEARKGLGELERFIAEEAPKMETEEGKTAWEEMQFGLYFTVLDDAAKAMKALGKEGDAVMRAKCLMRMGRYDDAKILIEQAGGGDKEKEMAEMISEFMEMNGKMKPGEADEVTLGAYVKTAGEVGATDKEMEAARVFLKRFPEGGPAKEIQGTVTEQEKWTVLRAGK